MFRMKPPAGAASLVCEAGHLRDTFNPYPAKITEPKSSAVHRAHGGSSSMRPLLGPPRLCGDCKVENVVWCVYIQAGCVPAM